MTRSAIRSTIKNKWDYRSVLAGNNPTLPVAPAMYLPGESYSTAINVMPFSSETFSTLSATLTISTTYISTSFGNGNVSGFVMYGTSVNKYHFPTDSNSSMSYSGVSLVGTYRGGVVPNTAGYYMTNPLNSMSTAIVNKWDYSTDTITTSNALAGFTNIGPYGNYTFSNNPSIYFGGGSPAGPSYYGGLVKFNTSTSTASSVWADTTATTRAYTSGAENGSTAAYLGGGNMMPYNTFPTNILKMAFATDTSYSTLSATLSSARSPARVGVQAGVCAYYAGGRTSGSSVGVSSTTVDKLTYATDTRSLVSTATVDRNGLHTWNTQ